MPLTQRAAVLVSSAIATVALATAAGGVRAHEDLNTRLKGYEEVPAVSSTATGRFKADIDKASQSIRYEISYSGLEGTVTQSHIHIGQRGVNGGITIWLCQTGTNPAPIVSTPTCPQSGTVSGTLTAADVTPNAGAIAQGIAAAEFAEVLAAIRAGVAYVNVHSSKFPAGEIRGQLRDDD